MRQKPVVDDSAVNAQRRGLGIVFIVFGLLSCAIMAAAALYSEGRLRLRIPAQAWQHMYLAHFFCGAACGAGYLWLGYRQTGSSPILAVMDLAIGGFLYALLFQAAMMLLAAGMVPTWAALFPGIFLIAYGRALRRGRTVTTLLQR